MRMQRPVRSQARSLGEGRVVRGSHAHIVMARGAECRSPFDKLMIYDARHRESLHRTNGTPLHAPAYLRMQREFSSRTSAKLRA